MCGAPSSRAAAFSSSSRTSTTATGVSSGSRPTTAGRSTRIPCPVPCRSPGRPSTQVVAVNEAQFLDDGICAVVDALADAGVRVIVAGTDMDFRGEPFGPMGPLLARAERIDKLTAICVVCGDPATRNQRLIDGEPAPAEGPTIHVGGSESYEARCRRCHAVPQRDRAQRELLPRDGTEKWKGI